MDLDVIDVNNSLYIYKKELLWVPNFFLARSMPNAWSENEKFHTDLYATIDPFFTPNIAKNTSISMYIGVKKKLTNQQPLTHKAKKSSLSTWKSKNSFPRNPALYGKPARLKHTPNNIAQISNEYKYAPPICLKSVLPLKKCTVYPTSTNRKALLSACMIR